MEVYATEVYHNCPENMCIYLEFIIKGVIKSIKKLLKGILYNGKN